MKQVIIKITLNLLLVLALGLLVFGLTSPLMTVKEFYVFSDTISLISGLDMLWQQKEWGLVILLGSFSVFFPILKIVMLFYLSNFDSADSNKHDKHLKWLETYSKWSMLDVFVVALLVVSIKLSMVLDAQIEFGIYYFSASVILVMLLSNWIGGSRSSNS